LRPNELELLICQLNRDLLNFSVWTDDLLNNLDPTGRRSDSINHLRRLKVKQKLWIELCVSREKGLAEMWSDNLMAQKQAGQYKVVIRSYTFRVEN
jgi:hypothetical protein